MSVVVQLYAVDALRCPPFAYEAQTSGGGDIVAGVRMHADHYPTGSHLCICKLRCRRTLVIDRQI